MELVREKLVCVRYIMFLLVLGTWALSSEVLIKA
jgi:hypothetical protein